MSRPPKFLDHMETIHTRVHPDTIEALRDIAQRASMAAERQVSMSDVVRGMIEAGITLSETDDGARRG